CRSINCVSGKAGKTRAGSPCYVGEAERLMEQHVSTRRVFLQRGLTLLAVTPTVPAFLDQSVMAMADPLDVTRTQRASGKDGKMAERRAGAPGAEQRVAGEVFRQHVQGQ